jgi:hypothetical protein
MSDTFERKRQNAGGAGYHSLCTAVRMESNYTLMIKLRMFNLHTVPTIYLSPHLLLQLAHIQLFNDDISIYSLPVDFPKGRTSSAGILEQSIGARNRVGIWLSYRPARLHRLAELIPGLLESLKIPSQCKFSTCD